jgi:hypothetical protein
MRCIMLKYSACTALEELLLHPHFSDNIRHLRYRIESAPVGSLSDTERSASSATRYMTPTVTGLPHMGQMPPFLIVSRGSQRMPHFGGRHSDTSLWGKNSMVPSNPLSPRNEARIPS